MIDNFFSEIYVKHNHSDMFINRLKLVNLIGSEDIIEFEKKLSVKLIYVERPVECWIDLPSKKRIFIKEINVNDDEFNEYRFFFISNPTIKPEDIFKIYLSIYVKVNKLKGFLSTEIFDTANVLKNALEIIKYSDDVKLLKTYFDIFLNISSNLLNKTDEIKSVLNRSFEFDNNIILNSQMHKRLGISIQWSNENLLVLNQFWALKNLVFLILNNIHRHVSLDSDSILVVVNPLLETDKALVVIECFSNALKLEVKDALFMWPSSDQEMLIVFNHYLKFELSFGQSLYVSFKPDNL